MNFIKRHPLLTTFIVIVIGVGAVTAKRWSENRQVESGGGWGSGPVTVVAEPAFIATIVDKIEAIGTAQANESVLLTAKVTDTVSKVHFEDGDYVQQRDILVELTNAEETAQLAEAQASVDEATRQFNRVKGLIERNLASATQLDNERVRMETARARLDAIAARLQNRLIRAPFSGLLGFRNVSPGSLVTPGTPITTIDDIATIKLDFDIPESYLAQVEEGQTVMARSVAWPDYAFEGVVRTVESRVDPVTRTLTVRAHVDNEARRLRPGMLLTVELVFDEDQALVVPESAIVPIQDRQYVYTISEEGTAVRREVAVGRRRPGIVEITSGLQSGEPIITQGVIKMSPGTSVVTRKQSGAGPVAQEQSGGS